MLLQRILSPLGECYIAVNGKEAIESFILAKKNKEPYDLICLDILMPEMDGQTVLQQIREMEERDDISGANRVKIIMTTALDDSESIMRSIVKYKCNS